MSDSTHNPLGDFLRSRREQLSPDRAGVPDTRRRRTPGLRREEVAALAGIGVDWYVRLEQGRCVSPSTTTVDALARALQLGAAEHAHLRELTRNTERGHFVRESVPDALRQWVDTLPTPAYVTGRRWDVLTWNRAADELFGFRALPEEDRNILINLLTKPASRRMFGAGWAEQAQRVLAQFRVTHDLWADDPAFVALLRRLREGCPEFTAWWKGHNVRGSAAGTKLVRHPKKGLQRYAHVSLQSNDNPSLRLVVYTPELRVRT
jgi:transcriptional regulator with XRE-family HTH domain